MPFPDRLCKGYSFISSHVFFLSGFQKFYLHFPLQCSATQCCVMNFSSYSASVLQTGILADVCQKKLPFLDQKKNPVVEFWPKGAYAEAPFLEFYWGADVNTSRPEKNVSLAQIIWQSSALFVKISTQHIWPIRCFLSILQKFINFWPVGVCWHCYEAIRLSEPIC